MNFKPIVGKDVLANIKFFTNVDYGGYSKNVVRNTENGLVLPNCTGLAQGCFDLQYYWQTGERYTASENAFIFDAENFWWQVTNPSGQMYGKLNYSFTVPVVGSMGVFDDGAEGHVFYVNEVVDQDTIRIIESGYSWNILYRTDTYTRSSNWGWSTSYQFKGFIYPPFEFTPIPPFIKSKTLPLWMMTRQL